MLTAGALTPSLAIAGYQWQVSATAGGIYTNILGATANTYTVVAGDLGKYIHVVATGTGGYIGTVTSTQTAVIAAIPAPSRVENLTMLLNPDYTVTLSWDKPLSGSFTGFRVIRNGVNISGDIKPNQTTFTDNNTVRGETYSYSVVTLDSNTGLTSTLPPTRSITIPAPVVAAAVSDAYSYAPADTSTNTDTSLGADNEVQANVTEDKQTTDDQSGFPIWGIILLVILALVGSYLIWNQKPAAEPIVRVETKNTRSTGSGSTTKKK